MNREEFMNIVKEKIEEEPILDVDKAFISENCKECKNGIYLLYDMDNIVIYIGITANGNTASFYSRMYGNGNSAHCNKIWFSKVKKFRFKKFSRLDKRELVLIERLMIYKYNQPIYNDGLKVVSDYEAIENKL